MTLVFKAALHAHVAVDEADPRNLRIDSVGVVLSHDVEGALFQFFRRVAAVENLIDFRE